MLSAPASSRFSLNYLVSLKFHDDWTEIINERQAEHLHTGSFPQEASIIEPVGINVFSCSSSGLLKLDRLTGTRPDVSAAVGYYDNAAAIVMGVTMETKSASSQHEYRRWAL